MFHPNGLYLFNIFCSHRLILVHLLWKNRRTLSDYMQKKSKPFVTFPHIHRQHEEEEEKKKKKKKAKFRTWAVSFSTQKFLLRYSSIQMKCQGGNKYALSITVRFDQSTRKFGTISFARLFKFTKHIALLFYLLSPYLLLCMRGSRNVRTNMHIIKIITKFCAHCSTVCGMANSDAGRIRTQ